SQRLAGGCNRRRSLAAADGRPRPDRSRQTDGGRAPVRRRARGAARRARAGGRLSISRESDAVAGDPAWPRGRALERHGPEARGQVPAHRGDEGHPAGQPLRYAYNSFSYYGEDIARSVERVARFGYDAIELVGEPEQ